MRSSRLLPAAAAIALLAIPAARAADGESVYPRTYTAEDCQDLTVQLSDSMRYSNLDPGTAASIQADSARAERACNSGQYAAGTRILRDLVDRVIAARQ
jgi:hypothetical protein